jgi:electron transport complex protein RnfB
VDAIVGATKMMHTVIESECTGCEKCVPVCPVDCIDMIPEEPTPQTWAWPEPARSEEPLIQTLGQKA